MNISGTLHLYSGEDRELFFVFDDYIAQELYNIAEFKLDDIETRRTYISVGLDRFIHRRTLSFSRKQTEIKVSLCNLKTKDNLRALTALYDWFAPSSTNRPEVIQVVGTLNKVGYQGSRVWELSIEEPIDLVSPPGLRRRTKRSSPARKALARRALASREDLAAIGREAERRTLRVLGRTYPSPKFSCLWRDQFLDSEKLEIREQGIICDIDIWDEELCLPTAFMEIKAQQIRSSRQGPAFYLSSAEWRSFEAAKAIQVPYRIWLVQYRERADLESVNGRIRIWECDRLEPTWLTPDTMFVEPPINRLRAIQVD